MIWIITFMFMASLFGLASMFGAIEIAGSNTTFADLPDEELPSTMLQEARARDKEFEAHGFRFFRNTKCVRRGVTSISRNYIHKSGLAFACDCLVSGSFAIVNKQHVTAIKTILANGRLVEVSSNQSAGVLSTLSSESMMCLKAVGSREVGKLKSDLDLCVREMCQQDSTTPLTLSEDMLDEVDEYTMQLCDWELYRKGMIPNAPDPLSFGDLEEV